jgi:formimidoylglutamate deiminase
MATIEHDNRMQVAQPRNLGCKHFVIWTEIFPASGAIRDRLRLERSLWPNIRNSSSRCRHHAKARPLRPHGCKADIGENGTGAHQDSPWPASFNCIYNTGKQKECTVQKILFFRHALLPDGWAENVAVHVADGRIARIETKAAEADAPYSIALAGMANLHSHSFQRAMAGLTEIRGDTQDSFWTWRELMYRFALKMTPDDVETVAMRAFIEMLETGFSSVAEFHYLHHAPDGQEYSDVGEMASRIASAATRVGIELTLLPVFYAHSGFGGLPPDPTQRRFINSLDRYARLYERCAALSPAGVAPHSLRAVTLEELGELTKLAGTRPMHIHIAEQTGEVEACLAWSGMRPIEYLLRHAPVGENWCLVHATHADASERTAMAQAGAIVGLCPITEANLGDGIFPASEFSGAWGIGSDSNVLISVPEELRMLEYSQRLSARRRNVMASDRHRSTATSMYLRAEAGGAQALGAKGGLAVGALANIVTLEGDDPEIALARWVFSRHASSVREVWVRGVQRVADGKHEMARDASQRFDAVLKRLLREPL